MAIKDLMNHLEAVVYACALVLFMFSGVMPPMQPCEDSKNATAILSNLAHAKVFEEAKRKLTTAAADGNEHSIVFGKDAVGDSIISPLSPAGLKNVSAVDLNFPGAYADIHNHPSNTVPSTGDIYNLILTNGKNLEFTSRITLLANGTVYAVSVYNRELASSFTRNYPAEDAKGFSPRFPEKLFNEFAELKSYLISIQRIEKTTADEMATAYILDKYQSGVSLFRLLDDNRFARVYITQTESPGGSAAYHLNVCKD